MARHDSTPHKNTDRRAKNKVGLERTGFLSMFVCALILLKLLFYARAVWRDCATCWIHCFVDKALLLK